MFSLHLNAKGSCYSSFGVIAPPNPKVARLMNQAMKHHWSFKELIGFAKEIRHERALSIEMINTGYDLLVKAKRSSEALEKSFSILLKNKNGQWLMGGVVHGSKAHQKSNEYLAEIISLYQKLTEALQFYINNYSKNQQINYKDIDFLVMEIMELSERAHRLHK